MNYVKIAALFFAIGFAPMAMGQNGTGGSSQGVTFKNNGTHKVVAYVYHHGADQGGIANLAYHHWLDGGTSATYVPSDWVRDWDEYMAAFKTMGNVAMIIGGAFLSVVTAQPEVEAAIAEGVAVEAEAAAEEAVSDATSFLSKFYPTSLADLTATAVKAFTGFDWNDMCEVTEAFSHWRTAAQMDEFVQMAAIDNVDVYTDEIMSHYTTALLSKNIFTIDEETDLWAEQQELTNFGKKLKIAKAWSEQSKPFLNGLAKPVLTKLGPMGYEMGEKIHGYIVDPEGTLWVSVGMFGFATAVPKIVATNKIKLFKKVLQKLIVKKALKNIVYDLSSDPDVGEAGFVKYKDLPEEDKESVDAHRARHRTNGGVPHSLAHWAKDEFRYVVEFNGQLYQNKAGQIQDPNHEVGSSPSGDYYLAPWYEPGQKGHDLYWEQYASPPWPATEFYCGLTEVDPSVPQYIESTYVVDKNNTITTSVSDVVGGAPAGSAPEHGQFQVSFKADPEITWWKAIHIMHANGSGYLSLNTANNNGVFNSGVLDLGDYVAADGTVTLKFWGAKLLGVHTYLGKTRIGAFALRSKHITFDWQNDGSKSSDFYTLEPQYDLNGDMTDVITTTATALPGEDMTDKAQVSFSIAPGITWWKSIQVKKKDGSKDILQPGGSLTTPHYTADQFGTDGIKVEFWEAKTFGVHTYIKTVHVPFSSAAGDVVHFHWASDGTNYGELQTKYTADHGDDTIEVFTATTSTVEHDQLRFLLELNQGITWWKALAIVDKNGNKTWLQREGQPGNSPYSKAFTNADFKNGEIKVEFWKAKVFGVHSYVGEARTSWNNVAGRLIKFRWMNDGGEDSNFYGLQEIYDVNGDGVDRLYCKASALDTDESDKLRLSFKVLPGITWWKSVQVKKKDGSKVIMSIQDDSSGRTLRTAGPFVASDFDQNVQIEFWEAKTFGAHTYLKTVDIPFSQVSGLKLDFTWAVNQTYGPLNSSYKVDKNSSSILVSKDKGTPGQIKFRTELKDGMSWWKAIKVVDKNGKKWESSRKNHSGAGPWTKAFTVDDFNDGEVTVEFWKAKAFGKYTYVGKTTFSFSSADGEEVTFKWMS